MSDYKNFDPGRVVVIFAGRRISGFMDGTFVSCERAEDAFSLHVGATGDVTRVRNRNRTGSVTITITQSSPSNDDLSALAALDEAAGAGSGALMVKDFGGTTLAEAAHAWIRKVANVEFGVEASGREWVIDCAELIIKVGGAVS